MNAARTPSPILTIIYRDLMVLARNPHLFVVMAGIATVLLVAATLALGSSNAANGSMSLFAHKTFRVQFFVLYATAITVLPAMAAGALVHERRQDCFSLLLTSLIPPGWIVGSKLVSLICLYGLLYAGALPFTGIVYFFAGVEPASLMQGALVSFSLALGTTSTGLLASVRAKNHIQALYATGWCVALEWQGPWLLRVTLHILGVQGLDWLQLMEPANVWSSIASGISDWRPPVAFAAYQSAIAALSLVLARRCIVPRDDGQLTRLLRPFWRRPNFNRATRIDPIPDGANPVAAKDIRANFLTREFQPWLLGLVGVCSAAPVYIATANYVWIGAPFLDNYVLMIIIPPLLASLTMTEREMLESLGTTLLSGEDIVRGKISATHRILVPLTGGIVIGKVLGYLYLINFDPSYFSSAQPSGLFRLLILILSTTELLVSFYLLPRFSLFGALTRSGALAATFSSYASVILVWAFISIISCILSVPFALLGGGLAFPWVYRLIKYSILFLASRAAQESAALTIAQYMQTWTVETEV